MHQNPLPGEIWHDPFTSQLTRVLQVANDRAWVLDLRGEGNEGRIVSVAEMQNGWDWIDQSVGENVFAVVLDVNTRTVTMDHRALREPITLEQAANLAANLVLLMGDDTTRFQRAMMSAGVYTQAPDNAATTLSQ